MIRSAGLALLLALACTASPAEAALKLCNRTSYILYAATAVQGPASVSTQGWTRVTPGACKVALAADLGKTQAYVYARTSHAHDGPAHGWGGKAYFCVGDTNFAFETTAAAGRCADDRFAVPFSRIDSKGAADWITTFTQTPNLPSLEDARDAGLARLLVDVGLLPAAVAAQRPAFEKAIATFRGQMRMPQSATTRDLFDALETEALKVAAPAGYSVCNDTDEPLWAAIGFRTGTGWGSRGWWKVAAGACAPLLTGKLSADRIYLLAERKNGSRLVSGKESFCITQISFDIGRRAQCRQRGLVAAGFAATDTRGLTGFAAHIGDDGLLPTLRRSD